jgi:hypothetical protein
MSKLWIKAGLLIIFAGARVFGFEVQPRHKSWVKGKGCPA